MSIHPSPHPVGAPRQRRVLGLAAVCCLAAPGPALAQAARAFDHVHYQVPDPPAAQRWYMEHLGGIEGESPDRVTFGGMPWNGRDPHPVQLLWARSAEGASAVSGSAILSLGLSVASVDDEVARLGAEGVTVVSQARDVPGGWRTAVIEDPWGVRVELVEDPSSMGFHHVRLRTPDPDGTRAWYLERFGGTEASLAGDPAVGYGTMFLVFQRGPDEPLAAGYGVNHIGWSAHGIDAFAERLREKGVRFTTEPRTNLNSYGHRVAFVEGPSVVRIEVVEHTQCAFTESHH